MLVVAPAVKRQGTTVLIWPSCTYSSGAGIPSKVTTTPASSRGKRSWIDTVGATPSVGPRPWPKILTISPAVSAPVSKLPAFPTQARLTVCGTLEDDSRIRNRPTPDTPEISRVGTKLLSADPATYTVPFGPSATALA